MGSCSILSYLSRPAVAKYDKFTAIKPEPRQCIPACGGLSEAIASSHSLYRYAGKTEGVYDQSALYLHDEPNRKWLASFSGDDDSSAAGEYLCPDYSGWSEGRVVALYPCCKQDDSGPWSNEASENFVLYLYPWLGWKPFSVMGRSHCGRMMCCISQTCFWWTGRPVFPGAMMKMPWGLPCLCESMEQFLCQAIYTGVSGHQEFWKIRRKYGTPGTTEATEAVAMPIKKWRC